jgi:hypothetical protein
MYHPILFTTSTTREVLGKAIRQDKRDHRRDAPQSEGRRASAAHTQGKRNDLPKDDRDRIRFLRHLYTVSARQDPARSVLGRVCV